MTEETKRGRKPDPILRYRKAKAAADKLRTQMENKDSLEEQLKAAEAEEREAFNDLQDVLAEMGIEV